MTEPTFPKHVWLEDTGERRFPREGELYYWWNPETHEATGPWASEEPPETFRWTGEPTHYAIYLALPMKGLEC